MSFGNSAAAGQRNAGHFRERASPQHSLDLSPGAEKSFSNSDDSGDEFIPDNSVYFSESDGESDNSSNNRPRKKAKTSKTYCDGPGPECGIVDGLFNDNAYKQNSPGEVDDYGYITKDDIRSETSYKNSNKQFSYKEPGGIDEYGYSTEDEVRREASYDASSILFSYEESANIASTLEPDFDSEDEFQNISEADDESKDAYNSPNESSLYEDWEEVVEEPPTSEAVLLFLDANPEWLIEYIKKMDTISRSSPTAPKLYSVRSRAWERARAVGGDGTYPYPRAEIEGSFASSGRSWAKYEGDAAIRYMLDIRDEADRTGRTRFKGEDRFEETSHRLACDGIIRSKIAVKNYWNRQGRARSGFDERSKKTTELATSKQGVKAKLENQKKKEDKEASKGGTGRKETGGSGRVRKRSAEMAFDESEI